MDNIITFKPKLPPDTGEDALYVNQDLSEPHAPALIWMCECDGIHFYISPTEHVCVQCGKSQRF